MSHASERGLTGRQGVRGRQHREVLIRESVQHIPQHNKRKHPAAVPLASLQAAHSPWGHAAELSRQRLQPESLDCGHANRTAAAGHVLRKMGTTSGVLPSPQASQETSGRVPEGAPMHVLKRRIWRLDPETRAAFKESLYRISR